MTWIKEVSSVFTELSNRYLLDEQGNILYDEQGNPLLPENDNGLLDGIWRREY